MYEDTVAIDGVTGRPDRLLITIDQDPGQLVLAVTGEIDMLTAPQLAGAISVCLQRQPRILVLDLTRVSFISAAGLSALVRADAEAHAWQVRLRIVIAHPAVRRLFALTNAENLLDASTITVAGTPTPG